MLSEGSEGTRVCVSCRRVSCTEKYEGRLASLYMTCQERVPGRSPSFCLSLPLGRVCETSYQEVLTDGPPIFNGQDTTRRERKMNTSYVEQNQGTVHGIHSI